jgi:2-dehydro-3-deoxyphosphogluconate aldolase / (4S)-4-hydroxy-2-oxoglutarate aldolase
LTTSFDQDRFWAFPVVGILRGFGEDVVCRATEAAARGGLTTVEVAMNSADAPALIRALVRAVGGDLNVGAGTVRTVDQLDAACDAGAGFVVTPGIDEAVIDVCRSRGIPIFPGAFTPTEVHRAWQLAPGLIKLFPGGRFGPSYIAELKAPLSDVRLMPTGGVRLENLAEFVRAGADAFGVGSTLFPRGKMDAGEWGWIEGQAGRFAAGYRAALATKVQADEG